jgi:hypothetical protein
MLSWISRRLTWASLSRRAIDAVWAAALWVLLA